MVESVKRTPSLTQQFAVRRFFSNKGVHVKGMSESFIALLAEQGYTTPDQIFTLTRDDLKAMGLSSDKVVNKIIEGLEQAKQTTLPRFLYGLGLSISQRSLYALLRHYPTLWSLYHTSEKGLTSVEGVTQSSAKMVLSFFSVQETRQQVTALRDLGVSWYEPTLEESSHKTYPLDGKQFVLTGKLERFTRVEAEEHVYKQGGWASDKVMSDTSYLVCGERPGQKLAAAQKYGVKVIDEAQFRALISLGLSG